MHKLELLLYFGTKNLSLSPTRKFPKEFKTNSFYMNFCFQSERDKNAAFCTMY